MPRIGLAEVMTIKKITITDVAQQAGVSVTTVSLVLSGKGRISSTTVTRVNQAIESLGYVRNRQAATLRGGESGVIGLILRDICEPFYAEMTAGLSEVLEEHGKVLFLTQSGRDGKGLMRCFDTLLEHGVDGMVLAGGVRMAEGLKEKAAEQGVPLVCAARSNGLDGVDVVRPDNMQAAKLATEFLIKRGHSQIAYLGGQSSSLTRAERLGAFAPRWYSTACLFAPNGLSSAIVSNGRRRKRQKICCASIRTSAHWCATRRRWRWGLILASYVAGAVLARKAWIPITVSRWP